MSIERPDKEPGPVNLWGLVLVAIKDNAMTARLVVLLGMIGLLALLGVRIWPLAGMGVYVVGKQP